MLGLIKKDILVIKKGLSAVIFLALLPPLFAGVTNPSFFMLMVTAALAMLSGMQILNTMAYDEKINWRKNVMAFPILPIQEAGSKYCVMLILAIMNWGTVFLAGSLAGGIFLDVSINVLMMYSCIGMITVILYNILAIPLGYYFGCEKVKYLLFLMVFIPFGVSACSKYLKIDLNVLTAIPKGYFVILFCMLLLCTTGISLLVSKKILEKKK